MSMGPFQQAAFRVNTAKDKPMNYAQKMCRGPCKQRRSVGQFAPGDDLCAKCRRRGE